MQSKTLMRLTRIRSRLATARRIGKVVKLPLTANSEA
jgi:hypothetical protein